MSTIDYAMLFERTVEAYWGSPKTQIYFANYWTYEVEKRAILFSIVLREININPSDYAANKLKALHAYEEKYSGGRTSLTDDEEILKLLAEHKNVIT